MEDQIIISKYRCDRCGRTNFINGHALGGHKKYCGKPQYKHAQDKRKRKQKEEKEKNHKNKKKKISNEHKKVLVEFDPKIAKNSISDEDSKIFIEVDPDIIKNKNIPDQQIDYYFESDKKVAKDDTISEALESKIDDEFYLGLARDPDIYEFNFGDSFPFNYDIKSFHEPMDEFNENFLPLTVL